MGGGGKDFFVIKNGGGRDFFRYKKWGDKDFFSGLRIPPARGMFQ